jgi:hypothetical protein
MKLALTAILAASFARAQNPLPPPPAVVDISNETTPNFGVSVYDGSGLTGNIYKLKPNSDEVPNFKRLKPIGTIYTQSLAVPPRDFNEGFPGIPDVFEWFAIDYNGRFWIEEPGEYHFLLTSDDGSRLYIDGKKVVDNDGVHAPETQEGKAKLKRGVHDIHVQYFQGPRYHVALILEVLPPDGRRRIFSTREFKPPADAFETEKQSAK